MTKTVAVGMSLVMLSAAGAPTRKPADRSADAVRWELKFTEDFKGTKPSEKLWSRIDAGGSDWNRAMSTRADLVTVKGGQLHCWGRKNDDLAGDRRTYLTGGISTHGKFAMKYGKIEIRMKLDNGQKGAWPAVWMMPETTVRGWPNDGEIDIVERLNDDDFVYQTLHYGNGSPKDLSHGGKGRIKDGDWNVYALEWTPESIVWKVNGSETFRHDRAPGDDALKYPWTTPFFLMIDYQLGGRWVGGVDEKTLPKAMHVDWVRFYHGSRGGKRFSEFVYPMGAKTKR